MIYEFSKFKEQKIGGRGLGGRGREQIPACVRIPKNKKISSVGGGF